MTLLGIRSSRPRWERWLHSILRWEPHLSSSNMWQNNHPVAVKSPCRQESKAEVHENKPFTAETRVTVHHRAAAVWRWDEGRQANRSDDAHTHTKKSHWWVKWEKEPGVSVHGLKTEGTSTEWPHRALKQTSSTVLYTSLLLLVPPSPALLFSPNTQTHTHTALHQMSEIMINGSSGYVKDVLHGHKLTSAQLVSTN